MQRLTKPFLSMFANSVITIVIKEVLKFRVSAEIRHYEHDQAQNEKYEQDGLGACRKEEKNGMKWNDRTTHGTKTV